MKTYIPPSDRRVINFANKISVSALALSFVITLSIICFISAIQSGFNKVSAETAKDKKEPSKITIDSGSLVGKKATKKQFQETKFLIASQNLKNLPIERHWPVHGRITTYFSKAHTGIDIATSWGTPIHPFASGVVVRAGWQGSFGKAVTINHNNGYVSTYAHLGKISVVVGQEVGIGTIIGVVGSTGRATGPHLHFQLVKFGKVVNPFGALI